MERRTTNARAAAPAGNAPSSPGARPRSRLLPSLLGVVVGVCLCAVALLVSHLLAPASPPAPTSLGRAFCADLTGNHYIELHGLLAPPLAAQGSAQAFDAAQQQLDAMSGPVSSCAVVDQQVSGASATLDVRLTRAKSSATVPVGLTLIDGKWRISAYDTTWV